MKRALLGLLVALSIVACSEPDETAAGSPAAPSMAPSTHLNT